MNLLAPLNTEALVPQNTMPLKAADSADGKNSGSFSECLDGARTNTSKTMKTEVVAKKTLKPGNEKNEDAGSDTDKSPIASGNPLAAAVCTEVCQAQGDTNTDTNDTAGTAEGSADNTASSLLAVQENDKPVVSADMSALSKTFSPYTKQDDQHEPAAEIADLSKAGAQSVPVNTDKGAIPVTDSTTKESIPVTNSPEKMAVPVTDNTEKGSIPLTVNKEKEPIPATDNTMNNIPSSVYDTAGETPVTEEDVPVHSGSQSSGRPVVSDTVQSVTTKVTVSANASLQQSEGSTEINLNGTSGDREKVSPEFPYTGLTNDRSTREKEQNSGYAKMDRAENVTTEQVAKTALPVTPKTQTPDITFVQKGEAVDSGSQGKSADKTQDGQNNNTTAASAKVTEFPGGNQSQAVKDSMQTDKLEQMVPRKEIITEIEQDDIRKSRTEHTYQTNEKSGEVFSLQDSNATAASGVKAVHQKPEVADISRIPGEDFIITKKDNTSIELTIEPEGMGKLNIHLSLEKGAIHARINASENIGKDFIDRNLNNILQTLSDDGINIGSFSINLRDRKNEFMDEEQDRKTYRSPAIESPLPVVNTGNSTINIFV